MRHLHSPLTLSSQTQSSGHHVSQLLVPTATLCSFLLCRVHIPQCHHPHHRPHHWPLLSLLYPRKNSEKKDCITASVSYSVSSKRQQGDKSYCDWTLESPFQSDELMASTSQIPTYPPSPAWNRSDGGAAVHWEASCSSAHRQGLGQGSARNAPVIYHSCAHHKASAIPTGSAKHSLTLAAHSLQAF